MKQAEFPYVNLPDHPQPPYLDENLDLQKLFEHCSQELTLQQSKRDQLIAFYLTISGLLTTYLFSGQISAMLRGLIFMGLFLLGCLWLTVILRYRIYKEVYWLCCRTISSLYSADRSHIDKALLQHHFYASMCKCAKSIPLNSKGRPRLVSFAWKNRSSAEYVMFATLVLLTSICGSLGLMLLLQPLNWGWGTWVLLGICEVCFLSGQTLHYNKEILAVYDVTRDQLDSSFNKVFKKAWQLHMFC